MSFAAIRTDLEMIILGEVSQKEKDKYPCDITYMWNLKYDTKELIYETAIENRLVVGKGEGEWERDGFGVWD